MFFCMVSIKRSKKEEQFKPNDVTKVIMDILVTVTGYILPLFPSIFRINADGDQTIAYTIKYTHEHSE